MLEKLPDFSIDLHFECSSFLPLVKFFTPSDTYHIYKQGSNLRLDMHLLGFKKLKKIEGNISVVFKGRGSSNEGELLLVNHETKRVTSIFEDSAESKVERDLDAIMTDQDLQKKYRNEKFIIEPELDRKGAILLQQIEGYNAEKYQVETIYTVT